MGNYRTSSSYRVRDNYYYYDKLPARFRAALSTSAFVWDAKWFYDKWNKGMTVDKLITLLNQTNMGECIKPGDMRVRRYYAKFGNPTKETKVKPLK